MKNLLHSLFIILFITLFQGALFAQITTITFGPSIPNQPTLCGETWTESGLTMAVVGIPPDPYCSFDYTNADSLDLYPARLKVDLTPISTSATITQIVVSITDVCGVGCTNIQLFNGAMKVDSIVSFSLGRQDLIFYNVASVYLDSLTVESYEAAVRNIDIYSIPSGAPENTSLLCSDGIDNDGDGFIDCDDVDCQNLPNNGCISCMSNGYSFADAIGKNSINCRIQNTNLDSSQALGVADYAGVPGSFVSLGYQGFVTLEFIDNILTNDGAAGFDLAVFEVGPNPEFMRIYGLPLDPYTASLCENNFLFKDADGFYELSSEQGPTVLLDIDNVFNIGGPYAAGSIRFSAVRIVDNSDLCDGSSADPGADIDAVCAISSMTIEICGNGLDDDGDGLTDEGCETSFCTFNNGAETNASIDGNMCVQNSVSIGESMQLQPLNTPPDNPEIGTMYFDSNSLKLRVWDGSIWNDCW